jgi:hypothetical protein
MEQIKDLWAFTRLTAIRIQELKKDIAWGKRSQSKWWWDDEHQKHHEIAIKELNELTKATT